MILELLKQDDYFNESIEIEIAKGMNKMPESIKEGLYQLKRKRKFKR